MYLVPRFPLLRPLCFHLRENSRQHESSSTPLTISAQTLQTTIKLPRIPTIRPVPVAMMFENEASSASLASERRNSNDDGSERMQAQEPLLHTQLTPLSSAERGEGNAASVSSRHAAAEEIGQAPAASEALRFEAWFQHCLLLLANLSVCVTLPISYAFALHDGKVNFPACFFISSALDDKTGRRVGGFGLSVSAVALGVLTVLQHVSVELEAEADAAIRRRSRWG